MNKLLKRISIILAALLVLVVGSTFYFLGSEPVPEQTDYEISRLELRRQAQNLPGDLPTMIRYETIATGSLPRGLIMAGESFDPVSMPRPVFQIVYPDGSFLLVDSAYDRAAHDERFADQPYFDDAWDRLVVAMERAEQIVVTHEHSDHLGGVVRHPRPERLIENLRLTAEQVENPRAVDAALPDSLSGKIEPLRYDDMSTIAPGVVLKQAPGHTPGSQMVYVVLAGGEELLFVGDVVWNLDAITELKYRPRLITDFLLDEDRAAVLDQIRALRTLQDAGGVSIVVSHDVRTLAHPALREGFVGVASDPSS